MPEANKTDFAGLEQLEPGASLAADGFAFQALNPTITDELLKLGCLLHRHDEHPNVANPGVAPSLTLGTTGGTFANDLDVSVGYTLTDAFGGETELSPVDTINTGEAFPNPLTAPTVVVNTAAGSLLAANYIYGLTISDGKGGESTLSPLAEAVVQPGFAKAEVVISNLHTILEEVAKGLEGAEWRLWRIQNGSVWSLLSTGTEASFTDDGTHVVDCNVEPPEENSTVGANKVTIKVPDPANPAVSFFSVYACLDGTFKSPCLVGVFPIAEVGTNIVLSALSVKTGAPPAVSRSIAGAKKIDPDADMIDFPWKRPVNKESELPTEGNKPGDIRESLDIKQIFSWNAETSKWQQISGGTSFSVENAEGEVLPSEAHLQFRGNAVELETDAVHERTIVTVTRGTILRYLGAWLEAEGYVPGDTVTRNGSSYESLVAGTGHDPQIAQGILAAILTGAKATGEQPEGITISPDGKNLYICDSGGSTIHEYEIEANGELTALGTPTVATGTGPREVVITPDGKHGYVTDSGANTVSIYSRFAGTGVLTALEPATAGTGKEPHGIAVSPDGKHLYITDFGDNELSQYAINAGTGALSGLAPATVATGTGPRGIVVSPDGKHVYVCDSSAKTLHCYSRNEASGVLTHLEPATVATGETPVAICISHDGKSVYVVNEGAEDISCYSRNEGTGILTPLAPATVTAGVKPTGIAVTPDGASVYVVNSTAETLSQYSRNQTSGKLLPLASPTIATGIEPNKVAATNTSVYVTNRGGKTVSPYSRVAFEYWGLLAEKGSTGARGPEGPGPLNWLGVYDKTTTYKKNDAVREGGSSYISIAEGNLNHTPSTDGEVHWAVLAEGGTIPLLNGAGTEVPPEPFTQFTGQGVTIENDPGESKNVVDIKKTFRTVHSFLMQEAVTVKGVPGFFISHAEGQTVKLVKARYQLESGTEAKFRVQKNGANIAGFGTAEAPLVAESAAQKEVAPTAVTLAENDLITILLSSVAGLPVGLSVTLVLEHTV